MIQSKDDITRMLRETYHNMTDLLFVNDEQERKYVGLRYSCGGRDGYKVKIDISDDDQVDYLKCSTGAIKLLNAKQAVAEACRMAEKHIFEFDGKFVVNTYARIKSFEILILVYPDKSLSE